MAILPKFSDTNTYIRYTGPNVLNSNDSTSVLRFLRLKERAFPLKYPFTFGTGQAAPIGVGAKTSTFAFRDLDPKPNHVYEAYLGVFPGCRYQVYHPFDIRLLKWDERIQDITEDYTGHIEYDDSPVDAPNYKIWIPQGKRFPSVLAQNISDSLYQGGNATLTPEVLWIAAKWFVEEVNQINAPAQLWNQLNTDTSQSQAISFGGAFP